MNTIVIKGSDYSNNNILLMKNSKVKDIKVIAVYPTGLTNEFITDKQLLEDFTERETSIIYGQYSSLQYH